MCLLFIPLSFWYFVRAAIGNQCETPHGERDHLRAKTVGEVPQYTVSRTQTCETTALEVPAQPRYQLNEAAAMTPADTTWGRRTAQLMQRM